MDGHDLKCSFCGKKQDQVEQLVAGPDVAICNECVDLCNEVIAGMRARSPCRRGDRGGEPRVRDAPSSSPSWRMSLLSPD